MNPWTERSIEFANTRDYLDRLFKVYPMSVNPRRGLSLVAERKIHDSFNAGDGRELLLTLLDQDLFPIKDSYVAFLKRDRTAIDRNPRTVERLVGMLYEMGLEEIYDKITEPKETNRQIGPLFRDWLVRGSLGSKVTTSHDEILTTSDNTVLNASDDDMLGFAKQHLGYARDKGLDFIAKFNQIFVVGEAKFLTDYGGHQNAQFNDAIATMLTPFDTEKKVIPVAILDGVLYLRSRNKMYREITERYKNDNVFSALVLRDFLYSL